LTIADTSGSTVITGQAAKHATPIQVIINNIPATTAMSTHHQTWQQYIARRVSQTIRTASDVTAAAKAKEETIKPG
jgi:hypothetical protein